jgi:hypothetical protein
MASIENSIQIQRPVTLVYASLTDFERMKDWQPDLLNVAVTSANPLRVGTMLSMDRRFGGSQTFINADFLEVQRNQVLEYQGLHGRFRFRRRIELSSAGGETKLKDTITLHIGFLMSLFFFWYPAVLRRQTNDEWRRLKNLLESKA